MRPVPPAAGPGLARPLRAGRRRLTAVAAVVLLAAAVAACSSGDDDVAGPGPTTTAGAVPGGAPAAPGETTAPGGAPAPGGGSTPPAPRDTGAGPTTTVAAPGPSSPPGLPAPAGVGSYAPVYLRAASSERVVLEVRSQAGAAPQATSVAHVRDALAAASGKEVVVRGGEVAGGARDWTADDIRAAADTSDLAQSPDGAVLRLLFLRGGMAGSDTTLGLAVRGDVAAVFADRVDEAAGLGGRDRIERAVALHEAGHLLGLVDLFLDTGREDPEHPGHSANRGSVMYHAVESTLVGSILGGGPPTDFDGADLADLAAIRAG